VAGALVVGGARPSRWTLDLGYVSRAQAEWATDSMAGAAADSVRVLVIHHGPRPGRAGRVMRTHLRGRRLERLLFGSGVDLVLSGHLHFPHAEQIVCQDTGSGVLWLQAGTATCWRVNRRTHANSFTVVRALGDRLEVAWWYYGDEASGFQPGEQKVFARGQRAGLLAAPQLVPA
jgi:3',5'-cyclic AMP phosphodiesterase CpdA